MAHRDVFKQLRAEHRRVLGELPVLERAAGLGRAPRAGAGGRTGTASSRARAATGHHSGMRRILGTLARQFDSHMAAEEEVLFPMLARALPETLGRLEPLTLEHRELRGLLDSLTQLMGDPPSAERNEQVAVQTRDFVDLLRIHLRKEEVVVFRVAERVLEPRELNEVASRLERGAAARSRRARGAKKGKPS